jgi:hypothetical protein
LSDDLGAEVYALVADIDTGTSDQFDNVELALGAERAAHCLVACGAGHSSPPRGHNVRISLTAPVRLSLTTVEVKIDATL